MHPGTNKDFVLSMDHHSVSVNITKDKNNNNDNKNSYVQDILLY